MGAPAAKTRRRGRPIDWVVVGCCAVFILVLALSAAFEPSIRVLHAFQAGLYVAVAMLALARSPWGYGAGCFIAAFWNWVNLAYTTFIANGLTELSSALRTGQVAHPDQLIAVVAAAAHFVLIVACLLAYSRIRPKPAWSPLRFLAGGLLAIAYFVGIILLFGRQYVPLLRRVFAV